MKYLMPFEKGMKIGGRKRRILVDFGKNGGIQSAWYYGGIGAIQANNGVICNDYMIAWSELPKGYEEK
jgi:hypothetical protein